MKLLAIIGFFLLNSWAVCSQGHQEELRKSIYFNGGSFFIDEEQVLMLSDWLDSIPNLLDKYQIQLISGHIPRLCHRRAKDLLKASEIAGKNYNRPIEMYLFVALVYFVICFSLSQLVKRMQQRIAIVR